MAFAMMEASNTNTSLPAKRPRTARMAEPAGNMSCGALEPDTVKTVASGSGDVLAVETDRGFSTCGVAVASVATSAENPLWNTCDSLPACDEVSVQFTDLDIDTIYEISKYLSLKERARFERISKLMARVTKQLWKCQRTIASCLVSYCTDGDFCPYPCHRVRATDILLDTGTGAPGDSLPSLFVVAKKCPNLRAVYWSGARLPLAAPPLQQSKLPSLGAYLAQWCPKIEHFHFSSLSDFETVAGGYTEALTSVQPQQSGSETPLSSSSSLVTCLYLGYCSNGIRSKTSYKESLVHFVQHSPRLDTYTNVLDDVDFNPLAAIHILAPRLRELTVSGFGSTVKLRQALQILTHNKAVAAVPLEKLAIEGTPLSDKQVEQICRNFTSLNSVSFWSNTQNMRHLRHLSHTLQDVSWNPCHVPDAELEIMAKGNLDVVLAPGDDIAVIPAGGAAAVFRSQLPRLTIPLALLNTQDPLDGQDHHTVDFCVCQKCRSSFMAAFRQGLASRTPDAVVSPEYGSATPLLEMLDISEDQHVSDALVDPESDRAIDFDDGIKACGNTNENDNVDLYNYDDIGLSSDDDNDNDNVYHDDGTDDGTDDDDDVENVEYGAAIIMVNNQALAEAGQIEEHLKPGGYDDKLFASFLAHNGPQLRSLRLLSCDLKSAAFTSIPLLCPHLVRITIQCPSLPKGHQYADNKIDDEVLGYLEQCRNLQLLSIVSAPKVTYGAIGRLLLSCKRLVTLDLDDVNEDPMDVSSSPTPATTHTVSTFLQQLIAYAQIHANRYINVYLDKTFAELPLITAPVSYLFRNGLGMYHVYSNLIVFFSN